MKTRHPSRILVVDDDPISRRGLVRALREFGHEVDSAADAVEGRARLRLGASLLVVDADMPEVDGFDLARRLRSTEGFGAFPILMVTALSGRDHRMRALEVGIDDFISKPWEMFELFLRTEALLRLQEIVRTAQAEREALQVRVERLEADLRGTLDDLAAARQRGHEAHLAAIEALVHAAEYKDMDTVAHLARMRWYADLLARALGLAPREVEVIREGAAMHDVGKLGIPDSILLKPGRLSPGERRAMEQHTIIGERILAFADSPEIEAGRAIARSHHERWDGTGYPDGLAGTEIPLAARVCAVADVFDALTMDRVYRPALSNREATSILMSGRGSQFDPDVLQAFLDRMPEIEAVQAAHRHGVPEVTVA